jgi:hypothetical protein
MIYPILGYKHYNWYFIGSEIDLYSYQIATKNLEKNKTQFYNHIKLVLVDASENLQNIFSEHVEADLKISKFRKKNTTTQQNPYLNHLHCNYDTSMEVDDLNESSLPVTSTTASFSQMKDMNIKEIMLSLFKSTTLSLLDFIPTYSGPIIQALLHSSSIPTQNTIFSLGKKFYDESSINMSMPMSTTNRNVEEQLLLLHCTMCNPPFYDLKESIINNPKTVCSGGHNEMRTKGGEVCFICTMIADSLILRSR